MSIHTLDTEILLLLSTDKPRLLDEIWYPLRSLAESLAKPQPWGSDGYRLVSRRLQVLRKRGLVKYLHRRVGEGWVLVSV